MASIFSSPEPESEESGVVYRGDRLGASWMLYYGLSLSPLIIIANMLLLLALLKRSSIR